MSGYDLGKRRDFSKDRTPLDCTIKYTHKGAVNVHTILANLTTTELNED